MVILYVLIVEQVIEITKTGWPRSYGAQVQEEVKETL